MKEKPAIVYDNGKFSGTAVEQLFFADTQQQISQFWGAGSLEDISSRESLTLPAIPAQFLMHTVSLTLADGHERSAALGHDGNVYTIARLFTGKKSITDYMGRSGVNAIEVPINDEPTLIFSYRRLFAKTIPIYFHSHPGFEALDIDTVPITMETGEKFTVSRAQMLAFTRLESAIFSPDDLGTFFRANRYFGSALMGSSERMLYIVPQHLYFQSGYARINNATRDYYKNMYPVIAASMAKYMGVSLDVQAKQRYPKGYDKRKILEIAQNLVADPDPQAISIARDNVLVETCARAGYIVFASEKLASRNLHRIR